jgi:hypothetical protein
VAVTMELVACLMMCVCLTWPLQARGEISIKRLDTLVQEDVQVCAELRCLLFKFVEV